MSNRNWYEIKNAGEIDSPAVLVYKERIEHNINELISSIDDVSRLRPHIKTHKSVEVCNLLVTKGINKFKCATIAEAEILAQSGARDILLAYQPVGPKAARFFQLTKTYPSSKFSCLIDNEKTALELSKQFSDSAPAEYYIDVNVGMNRTGILPQEVLGLFNKIKNIGSLKFKGLHAYDGHLRDTDFAVRQQKCDHAFEPVKQLKDDLEKLTKTEINIIAGGSPTFPIHAKRTGVECSPGTFVYWDKGYEQILPEQKFLHAAVLLSRVVSKPSPDIVCIDLGHKAIASENPLSQRITFLNASGLEPIGHSEEHMVFRNTSGENFEIGDVLYGVPYHVCPTIALHDMVNVVFDGAVRQSWSILSRNRKITI